MNKVSNGYEYDDSKWIQANGWYNFGKKNGEEFFLKKFDEPRYPREGLRSFDERVSECSKWAKKRYAINKALLTVSSGAGNIVTPLELFLDKPYYIQVSKKVETLTMDPKTVSAYSEDEKLRLLNTIAGSMAKVHSVNVIHGDLKPGNIIISETRGHRKTAKIIDFDDSYFSKDPPHPEDTVGTEEYWSPELGLYKLIKPEGYEKNITCKSDVFALGVVFHEYWTGERPEKDGSKAYQIVYAHHEGKGEPLEIDRSIKPMWLRNLIGRMLSFDPKDRPTCHEVLAELNKDHADRPIPKERRMRPIRKTSPESGRKRTDTKDGCVRIDFTRNPEKVRAFFRDGHSEVVERWVAEEKGWV